MPPADSAALIVARFLKANHYSEVRSPLCKLAISKSPQIV